MKQKIDRLRSLMAPEEPGEWSEHDGGGRPNKPGSYVEVERRSGERQVAHSAFFYWCGCGLSEDIIRWRFVKEPPTDKVLASFVPDLLSHIDALEARVGEDALWKQHHIDDPTPNATRYWQQRCGDAERALAEAVEVLRAAESLKSADVYAGNGKLDDVRKRARAFLTKRGEK